jgi:putative Mg2+ transporter-C (MgtC) family protein
VALGAALFVLIPTQAGLSDEGLSRVLQGLLAGVGFVCAGTILKDDDSGRVRGLTTAAAVWLTAAIAVAAGMGRESTAVVSALLALLILAAIPRLTRWPAPGSWPAPVFHDSRAGPFFAVEPSEGATLSPKSDNAHDVR